MRFWKSRETNPEKQRDILAEELVQILAPDPDILNPNLPRVRLGRFCQQHEYRKFAYDEIHSKVLPDLKKIVLENEQAIISVFAAIMKNEQKTGMRLRSLKDNNLPSKRYLQAWAYFFNAYYFPEKKRTECRTYPKGSRTVCRTVHSNRPTHGYSQSNNDRTSLHTTFIP